MKKINKFIYIYIYIYIYIFFFFFLDSAPVFDHEQSGICGILEKISSFCIGERVVIKF